MIVIGASESVIEFIENHPIISLGAGFLALALVSSVLSGIKGITRAIAFERSRREALAYVAEGSMTHEQAESLLAAGSKRKKPEGDPETRLAEAISDWEISKEDADKLISARSEVDADTWRRMVDLSVHGMGVAEAIKLAKASRPDVKAVTA